MRQKQLLPSQNSGHSWGDRQVVTQSLLKDGGLLTEEAMLKEQEMGLGRGNEPMTLSDVCWETWMQRKDECVVIKGRPALANNGFEGGCNQLRRCYRLNCESVSHSVMSDCL